MIMLITQHWTTFLSFSTSNTVLILLNAILLTTCDYVSNGNPGVESGFQPPHDHFPPGTFLRIVMLHVS